MLPPCNNPLPVWHPNGTLYVGCNPTQGGIPLFSSPNGGFTWTAAGTITVPPAWIAAPFLGVKDGFLYIDTRSNWHLLAHRYNYRNGGGKADGTTNLVSGHAFSPDGNTWMFSSVPPYDSQLMHTDGPSTVFTSLERPHLIFDAVSGQPTHLVLAAAPAGTTPFCSGCRPAPGSSSSCVLCKLTPGIDSTYTLVVTLRQNTSRASASQP